MYMYICVYIYVYTYKKHGEERVKEHAGWKIEDGCYAADAAVRVAVWVGGWLTGGGRRGGGMEGVVGVCKGQRMRCIRHRMRGFCWTLCPACSYSDACGDVCWRMLTHAMHPSPEVVAARSVLHTPGTRL
jgi:hypothetical protein